LKVLSDQLDEIYDPIDFENATEPQLAKHLKFAFKSLNFSAKDKKRKRPESWTILTALKEWRRSKRRKGNGGDAVVSEAEGQVEEESDGEGQAAVPPVDAMVLDEMY